MAQLGYGPLDRGAATALEAKLKSVGYEVTDKQTRRWLRGDPERDGRPAQPPGGALLALADVFTRGSVDAFIEFATDARRTPLRAVLEDILQRLDRLES